MSFIRKVLAPIVTAVTGIALLLFGGGPPEMASIVAASVGQLVAGVVPPGRPVELVVADEANRANRARAYENFGAAVALVWQSAGLLCTFRPKLSGYVHGLAALVRAQRRFEDQVGVTTTSLGDILLYGSSETQQAALDLFKTLGEKLTEVGQSGKQGSPKLRAAYETASLDLGNKVVAWRKAAQADLGMSEPE